MQPHTNDYHKTFLKISTAFNTGYPAIETGDALRQLREIIDNTGPQNPLHERAVNLLEQIIQMANTSRNHLSTPATILAFPSRR